MKKLKAVTIFIFVCGGLLFLLGVLMLSSLERDLRTWELLQRGGSVGAQILTVGELRAGIITHSVWYLFLGLLTMVSGMGLFLLKRNVALLHSRENKATHRRRAWLRRKMNHR